MSKLLDLKNKLLCWAVLFVTCVRVRRLQVKKDMIKKCAAYGCTTGNESTRRDDSGKVATFHFPKKKPELNEKQILFINRRDWNATSYSVICDLHFEEHSVVRDVRDRLMWDLYHIPFIHFKATHERPSLLPTSIAAPRKSPKVRNVKPDEL